MTFAERVAYEAEILEEQCKRAEAEQQRDEAKKEAEEHYKEALCLAVERNEALALLRIARDDGQLDFDADGWARVDAILGAP